MSEITQTCLLYLFLILVVPAIFVVGAVSLVSYCAVRTVTRVLGLRTKR
jgi:hypothetical protein